MKQTLKLSPQRAVYSQRHSVVAAAGPRENATAVCLFASTQFPASSHFFVDQVLEVDDAEGALTEWKRFISIRNSLCISTFEIPDHLAVSNF